MLYLYFAGGMVIIANYCILCRVIIKIETSKQEGNGNIYSTYLLVCNAQLPNEINKKDF